MSGLRRIGATGHIGGTILHAIVRRFPALDVIALVRDDEKAQKLREGLPNVQTRVGSLQDTSLIELESKAAQVVINASPDGLPESVDAIKAALKGLASRSVRGFYVQTSGAFLIGEESHGQPPSRKLWSDISDIESIIEMPPERFHCCTDRLVRQSADHIGVAIVSPAVVYGLSPLTAGNRIPITIRDIIGAAKELGQGFTMSQGLNVLGYIHVEDLAEIYVQLVADVVDDTRPVNIQLWGPRAYYLACGEEHTFATYMEQLVKAMRDRGIIATERVRRVEPNDEGPRLGHVKHVAAIHGCGASVRCRSDRAVTLLSWRPSGPNLFETLPEIFDML